VFFCLLLALIGVAAWWTWKLMTPVQAPAAVASGTSGEQAGPGLGVLAYLEAQQTAGTNRASSLFIPADAAIQAPPTVKPQDKPEQPKVQPRTDPSPNTERPTPPRVKETITLTYRGMYVRGDGVPMAMIGDSKSRRTAFYAAGTNLFGLKLVSMEAESLSVNQADQSSATLKRGIPQSFAE
jgi:hypothetical protein